MCAQARPAPAQLTEPPPAPMPVAAHDGDGASVDDRSLDVPAVVPPVAASRQPNPTAHVCAGGPVLARPRAVLAFAPKTSPPVRRS